MPIEPGPRPFGDPVRATGTPGAGAVLELVVDADGRCLDGGETTLNVLGYSLEELRAVEVQALLTLERAVTAEAWRRLLAGDLASLAAMVGAIRTRTGEDLAVRPLAIGAAATPGAFDVQLLLVSRRPLNRPGVLHDILGEWRDAERRLSELAEDDPGRAEVAAAVEDLRDLYRRLFARSSRQR